MHMKRPTGLGLGGVCYPSHFRDSGLRFNYTGLYYILVKSQLKLHPGFKCSFGKKERKRTQIHISMLASFVYRRKEQQRGDWKRGLCSTYLE